MDALKIAQQIYKKINELEELKSGLKSAIAESVNAEVEYEKSLAVEIVKLREVHPVSILEKVAKGNLWEKSLEAKMKEGIVKALESNIRSTQAQLNGLQTIYRHFEEV
jgi:hypothetical protein